MTLSRRAVLGAGLALSACDHRELSLTAPSHLPPLKDVAQFPVGTCVRSDFLADPAYAALVETQVSQVTPEWEMKMEYIVGDDGSFRFDAPDKIAAFAKAKGIRLFGHTLVWYIQKPKGFLSLDETKTPFATAYRNYITTVVGRYRGQAVGWDVVNEAVADEGDGWRDSLWSQKLGKLEHMTLAFHHAREADPDAVLFLNDFYLELKPKKRAEFLRLAEALLKAGAPLTGLGTQTHCGPELPPGAIKAALADIASLGLPIHVSEMDVSPARARGLFKSRAELEAGQARVYAEAAEAFSALPARQRFAFTHWGLRDKDSWLKHEDPTDTPLMFDDQGRPKACAAAWERGLR